MNIPQHISEFLSLYPDCTDDVRWANEFEPKPDVAYEWVAKYAAEQFDFANKLFKELDVKGAAIIQYAGNGTGLVTLTSLIAVSTTSMNPWIIVAALPACAFAIWAMVTALHARAMESIFPPPSIRKVADWAQNDGSKDRTLGFLTAQWHACLSLLRPVLIKKATLVDNATWYFAVGVILMLLPLGVSICSRFITMAPVAK